MTRLAGCVYLLQHGLLLLQLILDSLLRFQKIGHLEGTVPLSPKCHLLVPLFLVLLLDQALLLVDLLVALFNVRDLCSELGYGLLQLVSFYIRNLSLNFLKLKR